MNYREFIREMETWCERNNIQMDVKRWDYTKISLIFYKDTRRIHERRLIDRPRRNYADAMYEIIKHLEVRINPPQNSFRRVERTYADPMTINRVIYNGPATIVFWEDGTKTVVKCYDETYDKEKGLAMAICKKALGNKGNYCNTLKKWL